MQLFEHKYQLPSDGVTAMMDFYALYALWWELGSGQEIYGYDDVLPHYAGRQERIDQYMEASAHILGNRLLQEMWDAAIAEATHAAEYFVIPPETAFEWFRGGKNRIEFARILLRDINSWDAETIRKRGRLAKDWVNWDDLIDLFLHPMWQATGYSSDEENADQIFGGPPWVTICFAAKDLEQKMQQGTLVSIISSIDHIYDLEHNSATLGEKLEHLHVSKSDLDRRFSIMNIMEFLPLVSPQIAAIIKAAEGVLKGYNESLIETMRDNFKHTLV